MMSNMPVIDKEYLSNVLKLDRSQVISDSDLLIKIIFQVWF